ncbi:MAG: dicarboxylate/amino acid:cation symporter [Anaerovibrio sp.]|uniref:dicarboxylate/amino acid:cation symporter n=1 Tax=Anaerovibrio lipolyticus TaxID=82374 RepID=UPI001F3A58C3|nr:dicarboxylate/amino acid:cation symporter [Anaerovibrio lipolyticus]MCF2600735.1 dicarboxylate/amino acid:cation symporter [Anaerovibrio lipolyticus]MDY4485055.1 dicarboxylate/amino acid:cation symporter [Anaerovibrio sp.]MDY5053661.1 dicarboxylate/amino acid:cation symporter [Anaerovibrio sp.]MDY5329255.1 dicarboxylate/amino acid:cation symporter [Anaerovibrio sp.]
MENNKSVEETAKEAMAKNSPQAQRKQLILWFGALLIGAVLGWMQIPSLNGFFDFVATVFTRLFQFIAVPTIALAVITTLAELGGKKETGKIFIHAVTYTLLTTFSAALVGLVLYNIIAPGNLPADIVGAAAGDVPQKLEKLTYYEHFLSVIPNNVLQPFLAGNVLSVLLIAAFAGLALAFMPKTDNREVLLKGIKGLQELLFTMIRGILYVLPIGILAFAAQLSAQIEAGVIVGSLGKYVAVVLGGNMIQFFIVLPLFLLVRGLNPLYVFRQMSPAVAVALFTKSSAGTLPVTLASAENNLKVNTKVSRFVLPICTTINMNGCAAFILTTSLFVMQNAGIELTMGTMITWLFVAVLAAVGNAGVPMGCYFLTLSLMSSLGVPLGIMGIILPIFTVIDMIETAENVWSDSCVCAMTDHDLQGKI